MQVHGPSALVSIQQRSGCRKNVVRFPRRDIRVPGCLRNAHGRAEDSGLCKIRTRRRESAGLLNSEPRKRRPEWFFFFRTSQLPKRVIWSDTLWSRGGNRSSAVTGKPELFLSSGFWRADVMNHHSVIDTLSLSSTLSSSSNTGPGARCASNINPRIGGRMKFWLAPKLRTAHARQRRSGGPPPYRHNRQVESEASSGLPRMGGGYTSTLQLLRPAFFIFFPHGRMGRMGDVFRTFLDFRSATISVLNCVSAMGKAKRQTNGFLFFLFFPLDFTGR
jgi:hypothetical protein